MSRGSIWMGGILGSATAFVVIALNYLGFQIADLPRASFVFFDWLARTLPGGLITFGIDRMVMLINRLGLGPTSAAAKLIEQTSAVFLFLLCGAFFGALLALSGKYGPDYPARYGQAGGLLLALGMIVILNTVGSPSGNLVTGSIWMAAVMVGWGTLLGQLVTVVTLPEATNPGRFTRRQFLKLVGIGAFSILASAAVVRLLLGEEQTKETGSLPNTGLTVDKDTTSGPAQSPPQSELEARFPSVPGTREELTGNKNFYRIDIDTIPPHIDEASWHLTINGLVGNPLSLALAELRSRPSVSQAITLECISNQLAGDLISTSLWTGVRLKDILEEAQLQPGATQVFIESADGFYESVSMADAMDDRTLLVYAMNNEPLPVEHGFPLRIYIPNRFGMKQPKWITRMEVVDHETLGYWVERGWSPSAIPPTTSVIDTVAVDEYDQNSGSIPVGGIAYAGARGISRVEVQVDDGPWQEAELRNPPLSPLTWVQWRFGWKPSTGVHTFRVRATDGTGALQKTQTAPPHPNGTTGIHEVEKVIPLSGK